MIDMRARTTNSRLATIKLAQWLAVLCVLALLSAFAFAVPVSAAGTADAGSSDAGVMSASAPIPIGTRARAIFSSDGKDLFVFSNYADSAGNPVGTEVDKVDVESAKVVATQRIGVANLRNAVITDDGLYASAPSVNNALDDDPLQWTDGILVRFDPATLKIEWKDTVPHLGEYVLSSNGEHLVVVCSAWEDNIGRKPVGADAGVLFSVDVATGKLAQKGVLVQSDPVPEGVEILSFRTDGEFSFNSLALSDDGKEIYGQLKSVTQYRENLLPEFVQVDTGTGKAVLDYGQIRDGAANLSRGDINEDYFLHVSSDRKTMYVVTEIDKVLYLNIIDVDSGKVVKKISLQSFIGLHSFEHAVAASDGSRIVFFINDSTNYVLDLKTGESTYNAFSNPQYGWVFLNWIGFSTDLSVVYQHDNGKLTAENRNTNRISTLPVSPLDAVYGCEGLFISEDGGYLALVLGTPKDDSGFYNPDNEKVSLIVVDVHDVNSEGIASSQAAAKAAAKASAEAENSQSEIATWLWNHESLIVIVIGIVLIAAAVAIIVSVQHKRRATRRRQHGD
jgi:hypothetical protein